MPKVYISNKSTHNHRSAEKYGELVYVTRGWQLRYATNQHARNWMEVLKDSEPTDYILVGGMQAITSIGAALFAMMHGCLNLLIYKRPRYVPRELDLNEILEAYKELEEENGRN